MSDYIQRLISSFDDKFSKDHQTYLSEKIDKFSGKFILDIHKDLETYFIDGLPIIKCLVDYDYWTKGKYARPHKRESIPALYCDGCTYLYKAHDLLYEPLHMYYVSSQNVHHIKFYKRAPRGTKEEFERLLRDLVKNKRYYNSIKKYQAAFNVFVKKYGERGA